MYANTCKMLPWLKAYSSVDLAGSLAEHFDIIPQVKSFEGFSFGPRLNFLVGISGAGRTRLFERMKQTSGLPILPILPPMTLGSLSYGEVVYAVGLHLLEVMPSDAALLCDDLCHMLDGDHLGELLKKMASSGKQAIITVTPGEMERAEGVMGEANVYGCKIVMLAEK